MNSCRIFNLNSKFLTQTLMAMFMVFSMAAHADNPKVKIDTNKGVVIVELFSDKAPATVKNFLRYPFIASQE
ncbi:MAG TPA: hypothetical protein ENJ87_01525 [Gammaproteobacteria bacterium]|nr:hypothetical protein [Gammaproteobacteria bacterium]